MRKEYSDATKNLFEDGKNNILDNSKIDSLIDKLLDSDKPYPVVSNETGKLVGEIDRAIVMKSMRSNQ